MKKILFFFALTVFVAGCASTPVRRTQYVYSDRPMPVGSSVIVPQSAAPSSQQDYNRKVIMQGLAGAATGAIAAEASGGKAGTGALVGAGTSVIGGALIDTLTNPAPAQQQTTYVVPNQGYVNTGNQYPQKKVLRKYDSDGKIVSEEEVWQ